MIQALSASSDVFALRREKKYDEAYQLALTLIAASEVDEWTQKAIAWCLIDQIKKDANAGRQDRMAQHGKQLGALTVAAADEVLTKQRDAALALCRPDGKRRHEAAMLGKQMRHAEAIALYRELCAEVPDDTELATSFAWELYRHAKQLLEQSKPDAGTIKRYLNVYLRLPVEQPSLLHSCMLTLALKLAAVDQLKILGFLALWNLDHLRPDDFAPFVTPQGDIYSSLSEKVILQAGKAAATSTNQADAHYILPYVDATIARHPDNFWLRHVKVKLLIALERHNDALSFGIAVVKEKIGEFWAWELLGTVCAPADPATALSCHCKALVCSPDEKYIGKLRFRLAQLLITMKQFARAKCEILQILAFKAQEEQRIPPDVMQLTTQAWFTETDAPASNDDFYAANTDAADMLLFSTLPWMAASLGESFTVTRQDGTRRTKRKLFVETAGIAIEASLSESKLPNRYLPLGAPLRVKGELDQNKKLRIYLIERRPDGISWDALSTRVGVVESIHPDKKLAYILIERGVSGVLSIDQPGAQFALGDTVTLKVSRYSTREGERYRILSAQETTEPSSPGLKKTFTDAVRAEKGMGFLPGDIFIPPPLMLAHGVNDGDQVSGIALWSLNKKHNTWGWKAVALNKIAATQAL